MAKKPVGRPPKNKPKEQDINQKRVKNMSFNTKQFEMFGKIAMKKTMWQQESVDNTRASLLIGKIAAETLPQEQILGIATTSPELMFVRAIRADYDIERFKHLYISLPEYPKLRTLTENGFLEDVGKVNVKLAATDLMLESGSKKELITGADLVLLAEEAKNIIQSAGITQIEPVEFLPLDAYSITEKAIKTEVTYHIESGTFSTFLRPSIVNILKLLTKLCYPLYSLLSDKISAAANGKFDVDAAATIVKEITNEQDWDWQEVSMILEFLEFEWNVCTDSRLEIFVQSEPWIPRLPIQELLLGSNTLAAWEDKRKEIDARLDFARAMKTIQGILHSFTGTNQMQVSKSTVSWFPGLAHVWLGNDALLPPIQPKPFYHVDRAPVVLIPVRGDVKKKMKISMKDEEGLESLLAEELKDEATTKRVEFKNRKIIKIDQDYAYWSALKVYQQKNQIYDRPKMTALISSVPLSGKMLILNEQDLTLLSHWLKIEHLKKDSEVPLF